MNDRKQAAILGAALTALVIVLFLLAARWQGVLPSIGAY